MEEAAVVSGSPGQHTCGSATVDGAGLGRNNCATTDQYGDGSTVGWGRFLSSKDYRKKIYSTMSVYLDYFAFAWLFGVVGPSLPDLQEIVRVDLQTASWIFTCFALGYVIGCPFHGFLYDKINNVLLMTIFAIASGGLWIATPWCEELWLMLLVRVLCGMVWGGTDSACHSQLFAIWASEVSLWNQLLYLIFGLGGTASSYVITHFVGTQHTLDDNVDLNLTSNNTTFPGETTYLINKTPVRNASSPAITTPPSYEIIRIQWAYIIAGTVSICAAIPLLVEYVLGHPCAHRQEYVTRPTGACTQLIERTRKDPSIGIVAVVIILMIANAAMTGMFDTFTGFLATFTIRQLNWSKKDSAFAVALFYISNTGGNITFSMLIATLGVRTRFLLVLSLVGTSLTAVGLTLCSIFPFHAGVWFFDAAIGILISPLWPSFFTYAEENVVSLAGKMGAALISAGACGTLVTPIIIGYTMDNLSPITFTYAMLIECVVIFSCFLSVFYVYRERTDMYTTF